MDTHKPYSRRDFTHAVNCSAIVAWAIVEIVVSSNIGFSTLPWNSLLGLPIAFVSVWIFGAPFIYFAMRDNISFPRAALLGLTITAICALVYTVLLRTNDLLLKANRLEKLPDGSVGRHLTIDGYLTTVGLQELIQDVVIYLITGVVIGIVVRVIVGPGRVRES